MMMMNAWQKRMKHGIWEALKESLLKSDRKLERLQFHSHSHSQTWSPHIQHVWVTHIHRRGHHTYGMSGVAFLEVKNSQNFEASVTDIVDANPQLQVLFHWRSVTSILSRSLGFPNIRVYFHHFCYSLEI